MEFNIVDNASLDDTPTVSERLTAELDNVCYLRIPNKGRGRALKLAWENSDMEVVSYMDVDLSTNLEAFPLLITAIATEGYDIAIGSRHDRMADVRRSLQRDLLSRGYNLLVKAMFAINFSDAQCGFKALRRSIVQELLPLTVNGNWFFDSELLILAEQMGYRIKEIPVQWREDSDTRVNVVRTICEDLGGLIRLRFTQPWRDHIRE